MWFGHYFETESDFSYVPEPPVFEVTAMEGATWLAAEVDEGGSELEVEEVQVWWSNDDAVVFVHRACREFLRNSDRGSRMSRLMQREDEA